MRILQAPSNIANQAWLMAEGLRAQGHDVRVWQYGDPGFGFSVDRLIQPDDDPASYMRTFREALDEDFDVVHFHFARSLIPARRHLPWYWDLPVWRSLDKKVVFTFHGSDVRLRSHHVEEDEWSFYRYADIPCDEERIAGQLAVIRNYAEVMTVGSVLDRPYVPEAVYLQKLVDTRQLVEVGPSRRKRPVVLHAPSRRSTKGTEFVLEGLRALESRGVGFEVDLVEGVSHTDLLRRCANADIIVEKLLGGDAGVASLEAMALGKVAVARIRPEVLEQHPDMPVVNANPDNFVDVLQELLTAPRRRAELGEKGRAYVEANHDCRVVGRVLDELYARPPRSPGVAYPGWTVPEAQKRVALCQEKVQRVEVVNARLRGRVAALERRAAYLETARTETTKPSAGADASERTRRWRDRFRYRA